MDQAKVFQSHHVFLLGGVGIHLRFDAILLRLVHLAHAFALFKRVFEAFGHIAFEAAHFFDGFIESAISHDAHTGVGQTVRWLLAPRWQAHAQAPQHDSQGAHETGPARASRPPMKPLCLGKGGTATIQHGMRV